MPKPVDQDQEAPAPTPKIKKKRKPPTKPRPTKKPSPCTAPDCKRPAVARGFCATHYKRVARGGGYEAPIRSRGKAGETLYSAVPAIRITTELYNKLHLHASARGISFYAFCQRVLEEAAQKKLP